MDVRELTLEQKIGQVLCLGWDATEGEAATTVNAYARAIVEELGAGAVILMGRNAPAPDTTRALVRELQHCAAVPLFIAVDQEGGMVNRFGPPFHAFPGNMALGAITGTGENSGEAYARLQGQAQAREMRAVGVNWNFAPVVDVNCNPDNPIIGVRSFGEDRIRVAALGTAVMGGYQAEGVLACAKHFPGHGDTSVDSHLALPTVPGNRERLNEIELKPFRALIAAGVGAIMTTHILFPALDGERPATLSRPVLTGLLREELGFDGVVITDCLEMHAIAKSVGTAQGALMSLQAGADMALICHTLETQREAHALLLQAARSGELPLARLDEAVGRILAAKKRYVLPAEGEDKPVSTGAVAVPAYLNPTHDVLEREIARASVTIVRQNETLPLKPAEKPLLVLSAHPRARAFASALKTHQPAVDCLLMDEKTGVEEFLKEVQVEIGKAAGLIVATMPLEAFSHVHIDREKQTRLVQELIKRIGPKLIVVALREPYDLRHFPDAPNLLCGYGHRECSLQALADALFGLYAPTGHLPVTVPGL